MSSNLIKTFSNKRNASAEKQDTMLLARLIYERRWAEVTSVLSSNNTAIEAYRVPCNPKCISSHSLLHFTCRMHPPKSVVQALIEAYPEAVFERDCMNRFPLHIAAMYGVKASIISCLLEKNPNAAKMQDVTGKSPLQLEFYNYRWKSESFVEFGSEVKNDTERIVKYLCDAAPNSVTLEDEKGISAIESAIEEEADLRVVRTLQKASESYRKLQKSQENMKSKKDLKSDVHIETISLSSAQLKNETPESIEREKKSPKYWDISSKFISAWRKSNIKKKQMFSQGA